MRQLPQVNLNLLISLKALLDTCSTTLAAERLGVTQPTMSRHVAQLREMFDDPLLVRTGSRYAPTPRAIELQETLGPTLLHIERLFQLETDPAATPREFLIAAPDVVATYVLGEAIAAMLASASNFKITLLNWDSNAKKRLQDGEIHLAISIDDVFSPNMYRAQIGVDRWVCLMRKEHPLSQAQRELTLEDILAYSHARTHTGGGRDKQVEAYLQRKGIQRDVRVSTDGYLPLCSVLCHTDLIAIVPWHQARMNSSLFPLTFAPLAIDLPDVVYSIWWHERYQHDRGHRRLRELILPKIRDHPAHEGIFGRNS
jgi:DNA-binding transcriptional LysR family regulator